MKNDSRKSNGNKLSKWWHGTLDEPLYDEGLLIMSFNARRHWTSHLVHSVIDFFGREWKWCIGTLLAVAGLALAILKM
jgi:hypothetical protein